MGVRGFWTAAVVAIVSTALASAPPNASAARASLASVTAATPLSGADGWLVWSAPEGNRWVLEAYHAGLVQKLPAASRSEPFDAEVGTDAGGSAVVTFSRCTVSPRMQTIGEQGGYGGALVEPKSGRGCRIHLLELASGVESVPPIPAGAGVSDTTPSAWHGQITFARHDPRHGDVWQIETWSPSSPHRLQMLPHGRIPSCPELAGGCTQKPRATVGALQRDGAIVTFLWKLPWPQQGLIGEGATEVRVDSTDGSRKTSAYGEFGHEACTDPEAGLEYIWPTQPIALGGQALFGELLAYSCFKHFSATLVRHGVDRGPASTGVLEADVLALADEDGQLYGLVPSGGGGGSDSPGCDAAQPCSIEPLATPASHRAPRLPFVPFQ
jgi:hypothetical protein